MGLDGKKKGERKAKIVGRESDDLPNRQNLVSAGCCYLVNVHSLCLLLEKDGDAVDDFVQRGAGAKTSESLELFHGGNAAHHVLEAGLVGLVVGHVFDGR